MLIYCLGKSKKLSEFQSRIPISTSRVTLKDFSPGKQNVSDRELEKLALQGIFDYPHNRVNDQLLENIDLKKVDQRYCNKFRRSYDWNYENKINRNDFRMK